MKMEDIRKKEPYLSLTVALEMTPDDCSTDALRGKCKIKRYINTHGAIITEQDWCTKHGKEKGFYPT